MADSVPDPKCALLDETGTCVQCRGPDRHAGTSGVCTFTLALLDVVEDYWGQRYRTLVFPHEGWVDRDGEWQERPNARRRRREGKRPAPRLDSIDLLCRMGFVSLRPPGPRCYPTWVRCPECGNRRRLDKNMLHVVTVEDAVRQAWGKAKELLGSEAATVLSGEPVLLHDDRGQNVLALLRTQPRVRAALRKVQRAAKGLSPLGIAQDSLKSRAHIVFTWLVLAEDELQAARRVLQGPGGDDGDVLLAALGVLQVEWPATDPYLDKFRRQLDEILHHLEETVDHLDGGRRRRQRPKRGRGVRA